MMMQFNQYLAKLCLEKELTQGDCAEKMGIRVSTWSHWYHGRRLPNQDELNRIFDILKLDLAERRLLQELYTQEFEQPYFKTTDPERESQTLDTGYSGGPMNVRALPQPNYWYVSYNAVSTMSPRSIFSAAVFTTDHLENFNIARARKLIANEVSNVMCEPVNPQSVTIISWQKIDHKQYADFIYSENGS